MTLADPSPVREFDAALAWWRAAGVDCDFADDATAWLGDHPRETAPSPGAAAIRTNQSSPSLRQNPEPSFQQSAAAALQPFNAPAAVRRDWLGDSRPQDLTAFRQWWLESTDIDTARLYPRIAPRGGAGAALMVLVPQPEEHDRERLFEGPQGRLLANILAAMGLDDSAVYFASALPCYTPMADLAALAAGGFDAVLAHHIALAAPQRLLVLGSGLAAMLSPENDQPLREINHAGGKTPVMVSETLEAMLHMPRLKARFWRRWMEWSAS